MSDKRADSDPLEKLVQSYGLTIKESKGYGETDRFGGLEKNRVAVVSVDPLGYEVNADNEIGGKGKVHKKHKRIAKTLNYNQCGDGMDNDGDTFTDMKDSDCNSILDNS